jgi:hypothetical protein
VRDREGGSQVAGDSKISEVPQQLALECCSLHAHGFFRHQVCVWRKWLNPRSQRAHFIWENMERLLLRYPLPQPHILSPAT